MKIPLINTAIRYEQDVVLARQRARQIAALLNFESQDQVRIATVVSELARNVYQYVGTGQISFNLEDSPRPTFAIIVSDKGRGIPNVDEILGGTYKSKTGMGLGILGAKRLMDLFEIETSQQGTAIRIGKSLPAGVQPTQQLASSLMAALAKISPDDPFQELQHQNQELITALNELQERQQELAQLNKELEDTNRGVVALYAELDEKADYLRRASEVKSQFLSSMTHEFRTPTNSILSLCGLLLEEGDRQLTTDQEKQIKYIQKAASDLSELVNDLLDLAKIEAGKSVVRTREFTVQELFSALRGVLRPLLAHNNSVNLIFDDASDIPPLDTDESKLSQILRNLISNALKYTEKGEVQVWAKNAGNSIEFSVRDTGLGIAPEDQERIFEEFVQVEGAHQKKLKGTGLGLPLSKKLAILLGGNIWLESQEGFGSTFHVAIPAKFPGNSEVPRTSAGSLAHGRTILVVADTDETLNKYKAQFDNSKYDLLATSDTGQALSFLHHVDVELIVLDLELNKENAWSFLVNLKLREGTRNIPVFVCGREEQRSKAISLGSDKYYTDRTKLVQELVGSQAGMKRLLIIDDDELSRYLVRELLDKAEYQIIEAIGGFEGLHQARQAKPDVIILDILMPHLNGFEVLERLKYDAVTKHIPVIVQTSKVLTELERIRLEVNTVAILSKNRSSPEAARRELSEALGKALRH